MVRYIGAEILQGLREIKRGRYGRVINAPNVARTRKAPGTCKVNQLAATRPLRHDDGMLNPNLAAPDTVRPISRREYEKMAELGLFEAERVELIDGVVLSMSPEGAPHSGTIQRLNQILLLALHPRAAVRVQSAFAASDGSEPEPDVAVVPAGDYDDAHPSEAYLIIEVADSSLAKDRGVKATLYAQSGVPEYWVVNLPGKLIEVHTDIVQGAYTRVTPYRKGEKIRLQNFADVEVHVDSVLR